MAAVYAVGISVIVGTLVSIEGALRIIQPLRCAPLLESPRKIADTPTPPSPRYFPCEAWFGAKSPVCLFGLSIMAVNQNEDLCG